MLSILRYTRSWYTATRRLSKNRIWSGTNYMDLDYNIEAWLLIDPKDFIIQDAALNIFRGAVIEGIKELPCIQGAAAYPGIGKVVKTVTATDTTGLFADLLLENVKAIVQAETYLYRERGFDSRQVYQQAFRNNYQNTCIYFSHPQFVNSSAQYHHLKGQRVQELLFARHRQVSIEDKGCGFTLTANLADTYHQMYLALKLSPAHKVVKARGEIQRSPNHLCQIAAQKIENLLNKELPLENRAWQDAVGGADGCTHLADLAREAATTISRFDELRETSKKQSASTSK